MSREWGKQDAQLTGEGGNLLKLGISVRLEFFLQRRQRIARNVETFARAHRLHRIWRELSRSLCSSDQLTCSDERVPGEVLAPDHTFQQEAVLALAGDFQVRRDRSEQVRRDLLVHRDQVWLCAWSMRSG